MDIFDDKMFFALIVIHVAQLVEHGSNAKVTGSIPENAHIPIKYIA